MNADDKAGQARKGLFDSVKGKAKEVAGAVTGNDFARTHTGAGVQVLAAVHGSTTACCVRVHLRVGAVLTGVLLPSGVLRQPGSPQHSDPPGRQ